MSDPTLTTVAYFGPTGSYTELALQRHYKARSAAACLSIAEVFSALASGEVEYGFVPIENVAQGPVVETLDSLHRHQGDIVIVSSVLCRISHSIGVPAESPITAETLSSAARVASHEQALRQCSQFLRRELPKAALAPSPSTGAAADRAAEDKAYDTAVIAAKETLEGRGFRVLATDIADLPNNRTRFVLLRRGPVEANAAVPISRAAPAPQVTAVALDPGRDRRGLLHEVLTIISVRHQINLLSIHSRPDAKGGFVFHFDLEGSLQEPHIRGCLDELRRHCAEATGSTAEVVLFGSYPQERFHTLPFRSVGIIGGKGVMGRWFAGFLRAAGLQVEICDTDTDSGPADIAARSDVVLFSVPMSVMPEVIAEASPALRPGTLVVENSSIKGSALPQLLSACGESIEVLGIHTMFGGDIAELRGQNIIITKTAASGEKAQAFEDLLYKYGAKLTHADVASHDKMSAYLQSLFQLTLVALAEVLRSTVDSPEDIDPFSTPNSRNLLISMQRVVQQGDELLVDLQTLNEQYPGIRRRFVQTLFELAFSLENGSADRFVESSDKSRKFFQR